MLCVLIRVVVKVNIDKKDQIDKGAEKKEKILHITYHLTLLLGGEEPRVGTPRCGVVFRCHYCNAKLIKG